MIIFIKMVLILAIVTGAIILIAPRIYDEKTWWEYVIGISLIGIPSSYLILGDF